MDPHRPDESYSDPTTTITDQGGLSVDGVLVELQCDEHHGRNAETAGSVQYEYSSTTGSLRETDCIEYPEGTPFDLEINANHSIDGDDGDPRCVLWSDRALSTMEKVHGDCAEDENPTFQGVAVRDD